MEPEVEVQVALRLALLVDCDNADPNMLGPVLKEATKFGNVIIRRGYGDWSAKHSGGWQEQFEEYAFRAEQQFIRKGKNSSDIALVMDAMDILHDNVVDGFCLYTGDGDYTRLVMRMKEAGLFVLGFGSIDSAKPLVNAFERFIYIENLAKSDQLTAPEKPVLGIGNTAGADLQEEQGEQHEPQGFIELLEESFDEVAGYGEAVTLSALGFALHKNDPGFDPRTYGAPNLSELMKRYAAKFAMERREGGHFWVSRK